MGSVPYTSRRRFIQQAAGLVVKGLSVNGLGAAALVAGSWEIKQAMSQSSTSWRIVDPHVHVWKNDPAYPWPSDLAQPPKDDALPETLLGLMKQNGVSHTVIVHVIHYRWDCRYTGDVIKADPAHFQGVCRVNPQSPNAADELSAWVRDYGYRGVRLSPANGPAGEWIKDRAAMDAIWGRAIELGIPMCVLCPIERIPDVEPLIARHGERLDVCIDHMADCPIDRPDELVKLLRLAQYPRVFVKISHLWSLSREEYPYRDTHDQVRQLRDAFGANRLMFGTDWPLVENYCGYAKSVGLYRDELDFFSDEERRWILAGTAERLWPFKEKV